jgi:hypothetical protein
MSGFAFQSAKRPTDGLIMSALASAIARRFLAASLLFIPGRSLAASLLFRSI